MCPPMGPLIAPVPAARQDQKRSSTQETINPQLASAIDFEGLSIGVSSTGICFLKKDAKRDCWCGKGRLPSTKRIALLDNLRLVPESCEPATPSNCVLSASRDRDTHEVVVTSGWETSHDKQLWLPTSPSPHPGRPPALSMTMQPCTHKPR